MDLMFVDGLILGREICTIWDTLNLTSLRNMKTNVQWAPEFILSPIQRLIFTNYLQRQIFLSAEK